MTHLSVARPIITGMAASLPRKVYLDLNHWYALGDALAGAPIDPSHIPILKQLQEHVQRGEIIFPLSSVHYIELTENPRDGQRERAAKAMVLLSGFISMAPASKVLDEEMANELNRRFGRPAFPKKIAKFGLGAGFALGNSRRMVLTGRDELTDEQRHDFEARMGMTLSEFEAEANAATEYWSLRGPTEAMRSQIPNYDPNAARRVADAELADFNVMINTLRTDPEIATRPLDVICARHLAFDVRENYARALLSAGFQKRYPFQGREDTTSFLMALPSRRVVTMMHFHYLKDVHRDWKINDLRDIEHLSIAVPYCDVVVTDKKAWDTAVKRAHLDEEFDTPIFSNLTQLSEYLAS